MTATDAERLRDRLIEHAPAPMVDEYGAAERRATVERIRLRVLPLLNISDQRPVKHILDEEAAR